LWILCKVIKSSVEDDNDNHYQKQPQKKRPLIESGQPGFSCLVNQMVVPYQCDRCHKLSNIMKTNMIHTKSVSPSIGFLVRLNNPAKNIKPLKARLIHKNVLIEIII